jgi:hypothetical protein
MQSNGNEFRNSGSPALESLSRFIGQNVVYVREIAAAELKGEGIIPVDSPIPPMKKFFALCTPDGRRVAVLDNRDLAFAAAREHELVPVSVH